MIADRIDQARRDLVAKSHADIERDTAETWAARSFAAWELHRQTGEWHWYREAIEYWHEAKEHAAEAGVSFLTELCEEFRSLGFAGY